jgi:hypothetical protein
MLPCVNQSAPSGPGAITSGPPLGSRYSRVTVPSSVIRAID